MEKRILLLVLLMFFVGPIWCQHLFMSSNHQNQQVLFNPVSQHPFYILSRNTDISTINLFYNNQWFGQGITQQPVTYGLSFNAILKQRYPIGISLITDQAGAIRTNQVYGRFGIELLNNRSLSSLFIGIGTWLGNNSVDFSMVDGDLDDPLINDATIAGNFFLNASAGLFGRFFLKKNLYLLLGLSNMRFWEPVLNTNGVFINAQYNASLSILKKLGGQANKLSFEVGTAINYMNNTPMIWNIHTKFYYDIRRSDLLSAGINTSKNSLQIALDYYYNEDVGLGFSIDALTWASPLDRIVNWNTIEARFSMLLN